MRYVLSRRTPALNRVLVVESGARLVTGRLLEHLYAVHPVDRLDILTCYGGAPEQFDVSRGSAILTQHHATTEGRRRLMKQLAAERYGGVFLLCTGDTVMTKWKWYVAARVPSKTAIVNENADYFWLDYAHYRAMMALFQHRTGLRGSGPLRVMEQIAAFPFSVAILLGFAARVHLMRRLRRWRLAR